MKPSQLLTKEYLLEHFVRQQKSILQIARELGIRSQTSVEHWIKRHGLSRPLLVKRPSDLSKSILVQYYVDNQYSVKTIAAKLGVAAITVSRALKLHGIEVRSPKERRDLMCARLRTGCGDISGQYWCHLKANARERKIDVSVTLQHIWELFLAQGGICALTGRQLRFNLPGEPMSLQTASLDRIDSSLPYAIGNIQWVHKDVQRMKWAFPEDHFISLCTEVHRFRGKE